MATMYELTTEFKELLAMAGDPDIEPDAIADTLEAITGEIELKAENTAVIINELEAEAAKIKAEETRLADRRKALELAVSLLRPGDALLVAGKGHEDYQIIGTTKHHFSDQEILKELISC